MSTTAVPSALPVAPWREVSTGDLIRDLVDATPGQGGRPSLEQVLPGLCDTLSVRPDLRGLDLARTLVEGVLA